MPNDPNKPSTGPHHPAAQPQQPQSTDQQLGQNVIPSARQASLSVFNLEDKPVEDLTRKEAASLKATPLQENLLEAYEDTRHPYHQVVNGALNYILEHQEDEEEDEDEAGANKGWHKNDAFRFIAYRLLPALLSMLMVSPVAKEYFGPRELKVTATKTQSVPPGNYRRIFDRVRQYNGYIAKRGMELCPALFRHKNYDNGTLFNDFYPIKYLIQALILKESQGRWWDPSPAASMGLLQISTQHNERFKFKTYKGMKYGNAMHNYNNAITLWKWIVSVQKKHNYDHDKVYKEISNELGIYIPRVNIDMGIKHVCDDYTELTKSGKSHNAAVKEAIIRFNIGKTKYKWGRMRKVYKKRKRGKAYFKETLKRWKRFDHQMKKEGHKPLPKDKNDKNIPEDKKLNPNKMPEATCPKPEDPDIQHKCPPGK